jgi:protein NrfD
MEPVEQLIDGIQIPLWEWWIVWYFFLGGIAGGAYFIAALVELMGTEEDRPIARYGYLLAFPLIIICLICLVLDLGRPERFWHMVVYSKTWLPWPKWNSAISVGTYGVSIFAFFSFLSFVDTWMNGRLLRAPLCKIVAVLGALSAFFLGSYTGVLLASSHIPAWADTPLLGALFIASALSTGGAAISLLLAWRGFNVATSWEKLKHTDTWAMIVELVVLVAFLVMASGVAGYLFTNGINLILFGVTLVLGMLIPLAVQLWSGHTSPTMTLLISLSVLIGGFALRTVIVMGGQGLI